MSIEIKKDKNKQIVVKLAEPQKPKYLPNNPAKQNPMSDKKTPKRYIDRKNGIRTHGMNKLHTKI